MAVLTDLVIAARDEAEAVGNSPAPSRDWDGLDAKGHNEITFGVLLAVVKGQTVSDETFLDCPELYAKSDEGPWVYLLPPDFVSTVADLNQDRLPGIAEQWCEAEELAELPPEQAAQFLGQMKQLFEKARDQGKDILMWCSL